MKKTLKLVLGLTLGLTLFACQDINEQEIYKYHFESNGGSIISSIDQHELPNEIPTKDGYRFAGWYLDEGFNYPVAFKTVLIEDTTIYAKWVTETDVLTLEDIEVLLENFQGNAFEIDDVLTQYETYIINMLDKASQSVVMIDIYDGYDYAGGGSGVIYKKTGNDYYVLTNEHVVNGYQNLEFEITVFNDKLETLILDYQIDVLWSSVVYDLAVVKFTSTKSFSVIEFASIDDIHAGEFVYAIGSPLDLPNTKSFGMISMVGRQMTDEYGMDTLTIQHTASINPGNSGGALVDIYGKLVGINTFAYVDEYVGEGINGLFFAVQIDEVERAISGIS